MAITQRYLDLAKHTFAVGKEKKLRANRFRDNLLSKIYKNGFCEWHNNPQGINWETLMLWLEACEYDRLKFTIMGQNNLWNETDHKSAIMGEAHVGVEHNVTYKKFMLWGKSIAVPGYGGGNAGRDWPKAWTGLNVDLEVKTPQAESLYISKDELCSSRYIVVRGSTAKFGFKTIGTYTQEDIKTWPLIYKRSNRGTGKWCYTLAL